MRKIAFDWDQWNTQKNEIKHGVSSHEAESVFYDKKIRIYQDIKHLKEEKRWITYGKSMYGSILMIAFTIRNRKIRIITARKTSKKERSIYEQK